MSVLDDLRIAIQAYDTDFCKTEILNFSIVGGGTVLNKGEIFKFQVKVTNQGHLTMRNVRLQALGTSFADVRLDDSSLPWASYANSSAFDLLPNHLNPAPATHTTGFFQGRAKEVTPGVTDIVFARIVQWDASFDHILNADADFGAAEGKLIKQIFAG